MISLFFLMATMNDHILAFTVVFLCILGIVQNPITLEKGGPPGWISLLVKHKLLLTYHNGADSNKYQTAAYCICILMI